MIDGAIKYGKMSAEKKMFYLFAGILARQGNGKGGAPHGETLLHIDRLGDLDSKYLNQFPLLDFFTQVMVTDMTLVDSKTGKFGKKKKIELPRLRGNDAKIFPQ